MAALWCTPLFILTNPAHLEKLGASDVLLPPSSPAQLLPDTQSSSPREKFGTTLVTCFFDLNKMGQKTKHSPSFYLETGAMGTLAIASPMIIFTDSPDEVALARKRPELTKIVTVSVRDFEAAKQHLDRITALLERDAEGMAHGYSGLLFTIYHAKPEMMARAVELDPFHTERFLYMDVGAIRDWGGIEAKDYVDKQFPNPSREWLIGRENRVVLQGVAGNDGPCKANVRWVEAEAPNLVPTSPLTKLASVLDVRPTPVTWWIAGSIFGGNKRALLDYHALYLRELKRYLDADLPRYSLIDQFLMGALACTSDLVEVVRPPLKCCVDRVNRQWFFMLLFLHQDTYPQTPYSADELAARGGKLTSKCKYC